MVDFERFFGRYGGVQDACWCLYYHGTSRTIAKTSEEKYTANLNLKRELVGKGVSRGILAYYGSDVIASCQYGTAEELPRMDNSRRYREVEHVSDRRRLWRITCFFIDKAHRHRNLTRLTLKQALKRISEEGGGVVEAYPVTHRNTVEVWFGFLGIYLDEGFSIIGDFGKSNKIVRKIVEPS